MGIAVRVLNGGRGIEDRFTDDPERSLFQFVLDAPDTSVRWGISEYKETLFNSKQAYQLVREMDTLPADSLTPVLRRLRESAEWVYKRTGYLQFIGD
ncbi:hypothetical protein [Streptomyces sp. CRN 30]|uniref:hypothetical protein n=1 Tax=Streptomyces sp. CRN 30 TaxID=3075613 RepID=UPI002A7F7889|nr:hypothetical protein [Streptomyces sp. CRN 30]